MQGTASSGLNWNYLGRRHNFYSLGTNNQVWNKDERSEKKCQLLEMEKLAVCWPCDEQVNYFKSLTDIESDVN